MGNMILAATKSSSTSSGSSSLLPFLVIIVLVLLIYWTWARRSRQRQAAQMNSAFNPGQQVRTTSGMYGTIVSSDADDVVLEVSEGVHVRMMKRAVVPLPADGPATNGSGPRSRRSYGSAPVTADDDTDEAAPGDDEDGVAGEDGLTEDQLAGDAAGDGAEDGAQDATAGHSFDADLPGSASGSDDDGAEIGHDGARDSVTDEGAVGSKRDRKA